MRGNFPVFQCASICPIEGQYWNSLGEAINPPGSLTGIPAGKKWRKPWPSYSPTKLRTPLMATVTSTKNPDVATIPGKRNCLAAAGHQVLAKDILTETWQAERLRAFFW